MVLLDPQMTCHGPERLAGILFEQVELEQCQKPAVRISATQITSVPGSNVLLRCDASGQPTPQLMWARAPGLPPNHSGKVWGANIRVTGEREGMNVFLDLL